MIFVHYFLTWCHLPKHSARYQAMLNVEVQRQCPIINILILLCPLDCKGQKLEFEYMKNNISNMEKYRVKWGGKKTK